jgi:hypothetical protein
MCMNTHHWSRLVQGQEHINMPSFGGGVEMFDCVLKNGGLYQLIPYNKAAQSERVGKKCLVGGKTACLRELKQAAGQVRRYTRPARACSAI